MSGALTEAIAPETFARLIATFSPLSPVVAVAVSGGPDSMALAYCVHRWAQRDCIALIVDHKLRPGSADEASQTKKRLTQIGMKAEILAWTHEDVSGRLHEKARDARYRLLTDACRRFGAGDLLVAHHREDQAETILMRLAKGSGVEGLAGINKISHRDDIRILRPFLAQTKQSLIATCAAAKIDTVTDPSNASDKFARGRLRQVLPLLENEGMTIDSLIALGERAAEANDAIDSYARKLLGECAEVEIGGSVRLTRGALIAAPRATVMRALSLTLRYVQNGDYPPEREALSGLLGATADTSQETVRSLYGCLVTITEKTLQILREPAAATETLPAQAGENVLWDKRWRVQLPPDFPKGAVLRALGSAPHNAIDRLAPTLRKRIPQGRVRATLPALWAGNDLTALPAFDEKAPFRLAFRKQSFP